MKKFFIIIFLFFIIIVIGLFVFVATFDANRYKGLLIEKIEESIDKDVRLGNISLSFLLGMALRIDEFSIKDRNKTWRDAILTASSAQLRVKLMPLIRKDIQVEQLLIKELKVFPLEDSFENIELKAEKRDADIIIHRLTGWVAGGSFIITGRMKDFFSRQASEVELILEDIDVARLLPDLGPGRPSFDASLNLTMDCSARGLDVEKILDTLSAKGTVELDKAALKDMNILAVALGKLDMLPGLVQRLKQNLPERYSELLRQKHTVFKPMEADFKIEDGRLFFEDLMVESDAFYLMSKGHLGINRQLTIKSNLFIPKDLSESFVDIVDELKFLQDNKGMITMPIDIYGRVPDISVRPDIDYVLQRVIVSKGQELIGDIIKKVLPMETKEKPADATGTNDTGAGEVPREQRREEEIKPAEVLIKTIFDIISTPQNKKTE